LQQVLRKKDSSLTTGSGEEGWVDKVVITESDDGNLLVRIKLRDLRIPELGDKFSVRHGQKGVLGMIVDPSDMPWSSSGRYVDGTPWYGESEEELRKNCYL
jgi:DNA-directed RNA polymerase, beta subunit/140 kD subunit